MTKIRPCKRRCGYPALKGRQFCEWHALLREPAHIQAQAADKRLARWVAQNSEIRRYRVSPGEWPDGERWCSGCQSMVPLFYCTGTKCKACASRAAHGARVEKTYGITADRYDELFAQQGGKCAICQNKPRTVRLAVDHDHQTGAPRGLLCKRCNHDLLGGGHDDVELLWRAITYLLFPPASYPSRPHDSLVLTALRARMDVWTQLRRRRTVETLPAPF